MLALTFDIGEFAKSISVLLEPVVWRLTALITPRPRRVKPLVVERGPPIGNGTFELAVQGWLVTRSLILRSHRKDASTAEVAGRFEVELLLSIDSPVFLTAGVLVANVTDVPFAGLADKAPHRSAILKLPVVTFT